MPRGTGLGVSRDREEQNSNMCCGNKGRYDQRRRPLYRQGCGHRSQPRYLKSPQRSPRIRKSNDRGFPKAPTLASSTTKIEISKRKNDDEWSLQDLGRVITPRMNPL